MQSVIGAQRMASPYAGTRIAAAPATTASTPGQGILDQVNLAAVHVQQHKPFYAYGAMLVSLLATALTGDPAFMLCGAVAGQGISQM